MYASDVLPRPGGPASRTWSSASPLGLRRVEGDRQLLFHALLPDEVVERPRAKRAVERRVLRQELARDDAHAALPQRLAHLLPRAAARDRRSASARSASRDGVAELDERVARDEIRTGAGASTPAPSFSFSSSTTRCAVFLPMPGIASKRAVSSSAIARRSSRGRGAGDDRERDLRADAVHAQQVDEEVALARGGEAVELERVLADVRGTSRPSARRRRGEARDGVAWTR